MRADARRNYERIVATARQVFFEHGVDAPLDDIVKRAGVGAGTLYRHFPNRHALIEAVYRTEIEEVADRSHALAETMPPMEALRAWIRGLISFQTDRAGLTAALKAVIDEESETFQYCKHKLADAASTVLEPAQAAGAVRSDVEPIDLMRLSHGIGAAARYADEEGRSRMISILLEGLKA